ncbi:hypothetical protein SAY87_018348 [Trapa incisa]|uniref:Uncharacterized protein n=1 Tax=Trapa incisa TaxID=236973 RepID=A0AAN7LBP7_9MYRT|nr:hypothetical protein SAY87_018348 [Trapa incisa]
MTPVSGSHNTRMREAVMPCLSRSWDIMGYGQLTMEPILDSFSHSWFSLSACGHHDRDGKQGREIPPRAFSSLKRERIPSSCIGVYLSWDAPANPESNCSPLIQFRSY